MNRSLIYISASLLLAAVACQKEEDFGVERNLVEKTFTVLSENNDTKAYIGEENAVYWSANESIRVYMSDNTPDTGSIFTTAEGTPSTTADFTGQIPQGYDGGYYASYPGGEDFAEGYGLTENSGTKTLVLPWINASTGYQTANAGTFDPEAALMVSKADGSIMKFSHVFSYIKLTTDFSCFSISIKGNNDEVLTCGAVDVTFDSEGAPVVSPDANGTSYKYANLQAVAKNAYTRPTISAGTYYIAVLPQTLEGGFSVSFEDMNGFDICGTRSTTKSVTLKRGVILDLGTMNFSTLDRGGKDFLGSGTESDPYLITCKKDLDLLAEKLNAKSETAYSDKAFMVTNDIDCEGQKLSPIGVGTSFKGVFDGAFYTIRNYVTTAGSHDNGSTTYDDEKCGLFFEVEDATVRNLDLVVSGIDISNFTKGNTVNSGSVSAFIAQVDNSTVENCHISGTSDIVLSIPENLYSMYYGCLIGNVRNNSTISKCSSSLNLTVRINRTGNTNEYCIGGIVGCIDNDASSDFKVDIDKCRNTGNLQISGKQDLTAGGIVGLGVESAMTGNIFPAITNCVNTGNISAGVDGEESIVSDNAMAGGIIGHLDSDGSSSKSPYVYNSLNTGKIYAYQCDAYAGGLVGYVYDSTLFDDAHFFRCASSGDVSVKSGESRNPLTGNGVGVFYHCVWTQSYFSGYASDLPASEMNKVTLSGISNWSSYLQNPATLVDWVGEWKSDGSVKTLDLDF